MRIPGFLLRWLQKRLIPMTEVWSPDEIIGAGERSRLRDGPHRNVDKDFMHRWFVLGKNRWLNIYVHKFTRDDDDRALHDHPWWNLSLILRGSYIEHTISAGGIHERERLDEGSIKIRPPWAAHRIECLKWNQWSPPTAANRGTFSLPCYTLFITGPTQRKWGFHCPGEWKWHKDFGREGGCGESQFIGTGNDPANRHSL